MIKSCGVDILGMKKIIVEEPDNKKRLDKFLTEQLPNFSRSQIQKLVKLKKILVNQKPVTPHHFLKTNDEINLLDLKYTVAPYQKSEEQTKGSKKTKAVAPKIIYEDDDLVIINKPAGLLVHPRLDIDKETEPTLVDWLIKKYPKIKKVGDQPASRSAASATCLPAGRFGSVAPANSAGRPKLRPGIVHRLDKDASGVMVVAKNQAAFEALKKQFHDRQVIKEYVALTYGQIKADCANIEFPIGRAREGGKMAARAKETEGKPSITAIEVTNRFPNCTLIKAFPKTGRTHQIRVHLFALGNPLVGDQLYKSKKFKPIPTGRLMLHSHKLTIKLLDREIKTFIAPIPQEFDKYRGWN